MGYGFIPHGAEAPNAGADIKRKSSNRRFYIGLGLALTAALVAPSTYLMIQDRDKNVVSNGEPGGQGGAFPPAQEPSLILPEPVTPITESPITSPEPIYSGPQKTSKPSDKPLICRVDYDNVTYSEDYSRLTIKAYVEGNDPDPATSWLFLVRAETDVADGYLGVGEPVTVPNRSGQLSIYFAAREHIVENYRPAPGQRIVHLPDNALFMGAFGLCGAVNN